MKHLLLVDDDENILTLLEMSLERDGYEIDTCSDPVTALGKLQDKQYHLLVSDYIMDDVNGVHLLDFARQIQPNCVRVLVTGSNDVEMFKKAINNSQIYKFIEKPFDVNELIQLVEQAVEYQESL
jgi:DNA-binding NtrC family response regulator